MTIKKKKIKEKPKKRGPKVTRWTEEYKQEVVNMMEKFTKSEQIPILAKFAYENGFIREDLYRHDKIRYAIKRMMCKKEAMLEEKALCGDIDKTMAIFSLKQLGWKDKQEVEHSGEMKQEITVSVDIMKVKLPKKKK